MNKEWWKEYSQKANPLEKAIKDLGFIISPFFVPCSGASCSQGSHSYDCSRSRQSDIWKTHTLLSGGVYAVPPNVIEKLYNVYQRIIYIKREGHTEVHPFIRRYDCLGEMLTSQDTYFSLFVDLDMVFNEKQDKDELRKLAREILGSLKKGIATVTSDCSSGFVIWFSQKSKGDEWKVGLHIRTVKFWVTNGISLLVRKNTIPLLPPIMDWEKTYDKGVYKTGLRVEGGTKPIKDISNERRTEIFEKRKNDYHDYRDHVEKMNESKLTKEIDSINDYETAFYDILYKEGVDGNEIFLGSIKMSTFGPGKYTSIRLKEGIKQQIIDIENEYKSDSRRLTKVEEEWEKKNNVTQQLITMFKKLMGNQKLVMKKSEIRTSDNQYGHCSIYRSWIIHTSPNGKICQCCQSTVHTTPDYFVNSDGKVV